jgi:hypothetical protein
VNRKVVVVAVVFDDDGVLVVDQLIGPFWMVGIEVQI